MPKTYLRYEPDDVYGFISSSPGTHFDATGKYSVTAINSELKVAEILSQKVIFTQNMKSDYQVTASTILTKQNYIAIGFSNGNLQVFSLNSKEMIANFDLNSQVLSIRDIQDSILGTTSDGSVYILDLISQEISLNLNKFHSGWCNTAVTYKNYILSGGRDRVVNVSLAGKKVQVLANFTSQIRDLIVINDIILICCDEYKIYLYSDNLKYIQKSDAEGDADTDQQDKSSQIQQLITSTNLFQEVGIIVRKVQEPIKKIIKGQNLVYLLSDSSFQVLELLQNKTEPLKMFKEGQIYRSKEKLVSLSVSLTQDIFLTTNKNRLIYFNNQLEEKANFTHEGHRVSPTCSALNADDTLFMTASTEVKIWNVRKSICILTIELPEGVRPTKCMFLPGNAYSLLSTSTGVIILINLLSGDLESTTQISDKSITHLQLFRNTLFTASEDCHIKFFSFSQNFSLIQEREFEFPLPIKCALVTELYLFAALTDGTIRVHFSDSLKFRFQLYGHALPVTQMRISSTNERLFTISPDKTIRTWGLNFGECLKMIKLDAGGRVIDFLNNTHIALIGCEDGKIRMFDLDSYIYVLELGDGRHGEDYSRGHFGSITTLLMSKEGRFAISTGTDNRIHLWIQTNDLVSAEDEYNKRVMKQTVSEEQGRKEWEGQVSVNIDDMDKLEEAIQVCSDPSAYKIELCGAPWETYLMNTLQKRLRREILPDLLRNLDFERSISLVQLLLQIIDSYNSDFAVFAILRLFRNNLQPVSGDKRVILLGSQVRQKCLEACDQYIEKIDEVCGTMMVEK
ncbi:WD40 repeat protein [Spironucleus salmonicida]|uniref:WD40 domain-containing protein n=1 Tax=Spironucleus salmonicida TaxID=348837 RepID=V6LCI4_9EUKA|nr:WD40 repeat protein [Spironucleus salmonicida]|eukprot:EST42185.1 WD40 domain-containing protein [Spironucleus salmonicida]